MQLSYSNDTSHLKSHFSSRFSLSKCSESQCQQRRTIPSGSWPHSTCQTSSGGTSTTFSFPSLPFLQSFSILLTQKNKKSTLSGGLQSQACHQEPSTTLEAAGSMCRVVRGSLLLATTALSPTCITALGLLP